MPSQKSACKSDPFSSANRGSWTNNAHYFFYIDGTDPNVRLFLEHTQWSVHEESTGCNPYHGADQWEKDNCSESNAGPFAGTTLDHGWAGLAHSDPHPDYSKPWSDSHYMQQYIPYQNI